MKKLLLLFAAFALFTTCKHHETTESEATEAGKAFEFWAMARMYPDGKLHTDQYAKAFETARLMAADRGPNGQWEALGPKNIGGRTLCLAIHPLDSNILFLGSASGGIWKSTTGGRGAAAWERIETGFPVLGVAAIAIDPSDPQTMYIGTGEVYSYENAMPNIAYRTTRGTYGIGILKSTDGGATWAKSLDWTYQDLTGVQEIRINPLRPQTVWASTTQGLLRSYNSGASWQTIIDKPMAVDLEINHLDTTIVYVTFGSHDDNANSGIFRSTDGGQNFVELTNNLPASYSGKAELSLAPSNPKILYVSIGNVQAQEGLYKSINGGDTFSKINSTDVSKYQGWYSHDIAIKPDNPQYLVWGGIDAWISTNGGTGFTQVSYWYEWFFGQPLAGEAEGPPTYVHADIHHIYFHPQDATKVYVVCDGGLFVSSDSGGSWQGRNGGYQTQQFYANFSNSNQNADIALGGMQDNATAVYTGSPSWTRGIGGDGCCTAINPFEDQIMIGSSQYGNLALSGDGGQNWNGGFPPSLGSNAAFVAPFEYAPSNPDLLYLGEDILEVYDFNSGEWTALTPEGNLIISLGISYNNSTDVFYTTAPTGSNPARVYRYNGPGQLTQINGLPNRMFTDIVRHPTNDEIVYAVCGGFGSQHIWRTTNGGQSWTAIDNGIPDVPANCLLIDPLQTNHLYVGNDIGVWFSDNDGASWSFLGEGAPQAMQVMHLGISADRHLRVATHGLGVWQTPMVFEPVSTQDLTFLNQNLQLFPNPATDYVMFSWKGVFLLRSVYSIYDAAGKVVSAPQPIVFQALSSRKIQIGHLPSGTYMVVFEFQGRRVSKQLVVR